MLDSVIRVNKSIILKQIWKSVSIKQNRRKMEKLINDSLDPSSSDSHSDSKTDNDSENEPNNESND